MKVIVCGAGRIADEPLKRIGPNWRITLIEKEASKLAPFSTRFPNIVRVMVEDASSPVVLEKAGLLEQDCVVAMTNDDAVNVSGGCSGCRRSFIDDIVGACGADAQRRGRRPVAAGSKRSDRRHFGGLFNAFGHHLGLLPALMRAIYDHWSNMAFFCAYFYLPCQCFFK